MAALVGNIHRLLGFIFVNSGDNQQNNKPSSDLQPLLISLVNIPTVANSKFPMFSSLDRKSEEICTSTPSCNFYHLRGGDLNKLKSRDCIVYSKILGMVGLSILLI